MTASLASGRVHLEVVAASLASGSGCSNFGILKGASGRRWSGGLACFLWFLFLNVLSLLCFILICCGYVQETCYL